MPRQVKATRAQIARPELTAAALDGVLYNQPGHLIRRLQQIAVSLFHEEAAAFELTPVQYAALAAIDVYPGIDQASLASSIGFDRSTIGGVLDRLEAKQLIKRQATSRDRRVKIVHLTEEGVSLLARLSEASARAQRRILEPLAPPQRDAFMAMLSEIVWHHNDGSRVKVMRDAYKGAAGER
ncbi:MAG: MarR family transcriptional regulator [Rhodospirillales bacterium]|nr:MarR family transcriptional regulator [Rhodospirillales bacterium]